jgi:hypothetical protein
MRQTRALSRLFHDPILENSLQLRVHSSLPLKFLPCGL